MIYYIYLKQAVWQKLCNTKTVSWSRTIYLSAVLKWIQVHTSQSYKLLSHSKLLLIHGRPLTQLRANQLTNWPWSIMVDHAQSWWWTMLDHSQPSLIIVNLTMVRVGVRVRVGVSVVVVVRIGHDQPHSILVNHTWPRSITVVLFSMPNAWSISHSPSTLVDQPSNHLKSQLVNHCQLRWINRHSAARTGYSPLIVI